MASSSGFWEDRGGHDNAGGATYDFIQPRGALRYHLARILKKFGNLEIGEVLSTVNGVAVGQSASKTISRRTAVADTSQNAQGGVAAIESRELVGLNLDSGANDASSGTARNTVAADTTAITGIIHGGTESDRSPGTYPVDASGNGGGGKLPSA